jgi:hypothetical protein
MSGESGWDFIHVHDAPNLYKRRRAELVSVTISYLGRDESRVGMSDTRDSEALHIYVSTTRYACYIGSVMVGLLVLCEV